MQLKNYQKTAIDKLIKICRKLLSKDGQRVCVFKAPTGSGKTIMIADFLDHLLKENLPSRYAFVWISGNNLHKQSRIKLESYLATSRFKFSYLDDIQNGRFSENEIVFVNWHSLTKQDHVTGEYTNIYMRENENDKNLLSFINNTKDGGVQIILIVDESHYHYWAQKSQALVQDVIGPKLTIEMSATPRLGPSSEDIEFEEAGKVTVRFEDVVAEGMIKTDAVINNEIGKFTDFLSAADEVLLTAAIEKQKELIDSFYKASANVNPLILIQLPNESESTSALDRTKLIFVENYLKDQLNITVENRLLGIWLSERKENLEGIEKNDNKVKVLIFKQAIALGWDCPRAQILVMFREIQSVTFEIQTIGRILRMPEAKHYSLDELNRAYVYTNLASINIANERESLSYFQINSSHRKSECIPVDLPSVYLSRIDYGDLTLTFRKILIDEANKYFGINKSDSQKTARQKVDRKLDLLPDELTEAVLSDAIIQKIDDPSIQIGDLVHFSVPEDDLKFKYEYFAKLMSLPYAPIRSHTKIQQAIYDWFDNYLGYKAKSRIEIQRIVICSDNNQRIFSEIIETAKLRFKEVNQQEKAARQTRKAYTWNIPAVDYFNELYEKVNSKNYSMDKCYLRSDRSDPEKYFEDILDNTDIEWWYKNGTNKEIYFAIPYIHPNDGFLHSFYPDFIILFKSGTVGIFDTKSGFTLESNETAAKSDALQAYIREQRSKGQNIFGGIIAVKRSGLFVYGGKNYNSDLNSASWTRLEI